MVSFFSLANGPKEVDVEGASKAMKEGRLLDALKEYKAPKEVLMDKTVIDYSTKYEKAWKQLKEKTEAELEIK